MTRSEIKAFVHDSSVERVREVLDHLQALRSHAPMHHLPESEQKFLLDLRDHEPYFRTLADVKLQSTK